ncbi:pyridoxamine 5'-phosphate oxidase family protein [Streptomyces sp. NPDC002559]
MSRKATVELSAAAGAFLTGPRTATLATLRPDGTPHVTPVRFTFEAATGLVRVTTRAGARKARNVAAGGPAARTALCQADGMRWVTLEGRATVTHDPAHLAEAVRRYTERYRTPPPHPPDLVVVEIAVDRALSLNL